MFSATIYHKVITRFPLFTRSGFGWYHTSNLEVVNLHFVVHSTIAKGLEQKLELRYKIQNVFGGSQLIQTTLCFGSLRPSDAETEKLCACLLRTEANIHIWRKTIKVG